MMHADRSDLITAVRRRHRYSTLVFLVLVTACGTAFYLYPRGLTPSRTDPKGTKMTTFTTNDVANASGTKANITTTQLDSETNIATTIARHNAAIAAWKLSTTPQ